jgi:hypothetical protein
MRRFATFAFAASLGLAWLGAGAAARAQGQDHDHAPGPQDDQQENQRRNEEWGLNQPNLSLPQLRNAGPCPYVKVLYDAARYVELKDNQPTTAAVGFTGEIETLAAACEYKSDDPIKVQTRLLFEFGRGPSAQGEHKVYRYWVAVTDRNRGVLDKEYFDLPVDFPAGQDRVVKTEDVTGIVIPRADVHVSGANFEVLIGFDVTPQMAEFNRNGERFRVNASAPQAQASR